MNSPDKKKELDKIIKIKKPYTTTIICSNSINETESEKDITSSKDNNSSQPIAASADIPMKEVFLGILEFYQALQNLNATATFADLSYEDKGIIYSLLQKIVRQSERLMNLLHVVCPYCREKRGEYLGNCAQCDRAVCSYCGDVFDGQPLHRRICASFYKPKEQLP